MKRAVAVSPRPTLFQQGKGGFRCALALSLSVAFYNVNACAIAEEPAPAAGNVELNEQAADEAVAEIKSIDAQIRGADGTVGVATALVRLSVSANPKGDPTEIDAGKTFSEKTYTTDEEGRYRIEIPPELVGNAALRIEVTADRRGYLRRTFGPLPVSDFRMQDIRDDQAYWLHRQEARRGIAETFLRAGKPLAGRVLLSNGSPAVGAMVTTATVPDPYAWKFRSPLNYSASDSAVTDKEGRFEVITDQQATLTVELPGQAALIIDNLGKYHAQNNGDSPQTFRMPQGVRLSGRVLSAEGTPIPGAVVAAWQNGQLDGSRLQFHFGISRAADENGRYELPPIAPGEYSLAVNSRVEQRQQIAEYNRDGAQPKPLTVPIENEVFLNETRLLGNFDLAPMFDFRAVKTAAITVGMEFPDGKRPEDARKVDLTVRGNINGKRWHGSYATADGHGIARLIVPRGVQDVVVGTGLALHRRTPDAPFDLGEAMHLGIVNEDVAGLTVIRPRTATLKVQLKLPASLAEQKDKPKVFIHICAYHKRDGYLEHQPAQQRVFLSGSVQTNDDRYRGIALPNEDLILRVAKVVDKEETILYLERLRLIPGEERQRTIEIADR